MATTPDARWYRDTFGAPFYGLHRMDLQRLLADAFGPGHLHLGYRVTGVDDDGTVRALRAPPSPATWWSARTACTQ